VVNIHKKTNKTPSNSVLGSISVLFVCFVILFGMNFTVSGFSQFQVERMTDPISYNLSSSFDRDLLDSGTFVDVTDHGAVGDGETDDHGAIMDAADYAVDNGKAGVIFPSGIYGIGNKLYLDGHYSGLTFYSDSDAVIKTIHENAYRQFEFKADSSGDVEDVAIIGLELDGNKDNLDVDRWGNWGIHLWGDGGIVSGVHLEDLHIYEFSGNGIYINSEDTVVKNCLSEYNWGHGFAVSGDAEDVFITNITSRYNVSPDNPLHGSGMDIRGGDNIVVSNFTFENNGFGMKTSIYEPDATITNGSVVGNNGVGVRLVQAPKEIYIDNVETRDNGREGFTMRHGGTVHMGTVASINDGQGDKQDGGLFIADEMDEVHIEDLTVKNFPGYGINSYTSLVTIEKVNISGCDNCAINPRSGTIVIGPPELEESYFTIDERFSHDKFNAESDGIVINDEKFRAESENGEVEINLDDWTSDDRRFTASADDTVTFEFEGLKPYTSYEIYQGSELVGSVSTDSGGYLGFEHDDCSGDEFVIQEGGVNVVTQEPTDITSNSAVFNGEVMDMGEKDELDAYFRYRKTDEDEWEETECQSISSPTEYDENFSGLSPGTSYEYKAVAEWDDGEDTGEIVSFTTDFETDPYDWEGFLDPEDGDEIYKEEFPTDLLTVVDSVPDSDDDDNGTTLDYWGEFYIDGEFDGEKELNSEPNHTEYIYEDLEKGTYDLKVEWHYDLGFIEEDNITVTIKESEPDFELSNLQVDPKEMYIGTEMTAEIDVENVGSETGDYTAEFYKDTETIGSDTVTVEPGQTETASIEHTVTDSGTYGVTVEDLVEEIIVYHKPDVETDPATDIATDSSNLHGEVIEIGMEDKVEAFFRYRKENEEDWIDTDGQTVSEEEFDELVDSLEDDTTYEFKAVIEWNDEEYTGEILEFTTLQEATFEITDLKVEPDELYIYEDFNIEADVYNHGDETDDYTVEFMKDNEKIGEDTVTMEPGETETASIKYSIDEAGTYEISVYDPYDEEYLTHDVKVYDLPEVETNEATDITVDSAVLHGEVIEIGMKDEVEAFFRYREDSEEEWIETDEQTVSEEGFDQLIDGLEDDTTYEFKAVIQWNGEDDTGEIETFKTLKVATFELSNLVVDPDDVYIGENFDLEVDVENTGDVEGEYTAEFYMENEKIGEDTVVVPEGETKTASFTHSTDEANTYEVSVEDLTEEITVSDFPEVKTESPSSIDTSNAKLHGEVTYLGLEDELDAYFNYRVQGEEWESTPAEKITEMGDFSHELTDLDSNTTYEFEAVIEWNGGEEKGETLTFTTEKEIPDVETMKATDVTENSVVLVGEVTEMGDHDEVQVYFKLREKGQEDWIESHESQSVSEEGEFDEKWSNLAPSTAYEFKAVLEYNGKIVGEIAEFGTDYDDLVVETKSSENVTSESAVLYGELLGLGDDEQVEVYFEYKEEDQMEWMTTESVTMDETDEFVKEVSELEENTSYEYRAVAHGEKTEIGQTESFVTLDYYTLTVTQLEEEGMVEIDGEEITEWPYEEVYEEGTEIELIAINCDKYEFNEWTGDVSEDKEEIKIIIEGEKEVNPVFEERVEEYDLTIDIEGEGSTEPSVDSYTFEEGDEVIITATPDEDWEFKEWTGDFNGSEGEITITMDDNISITAVFEELEPAFFDIEILSYENELEEYDTERVKYKVMNTGDLEDTQDIVFIVAGDEEKVEAGITLEAGEEFTGSFTWEPDEEAEYEVAVASEDDEDERIVSFEELEPASFDIEIISCENELEEHDTERVKYKVMNTGDLEDTQDIVFIVDGDEEKVEAGITLEAGEEFTGSFTWEPDEEAEYEVAVATEDDEDERIVSFEEQEDRDISRITGFTIILVLFASVVALVFYKKKKH